MVTFALYLLGAGLMVTVLFLVRKLHGDRNYYRQKYHEQLEREES